MNDHTQAVSPHAHLGIPDPEWVKVAAKNDVPQLVGTPQEVRDMMNRLKDAAVSQVPPIAERLTVRDVSIATSDGASILVRIYTPANRDDANAGPGTFFIHGGGWTLGDLDTEDLTCRAMSLYCGHVVVSVDYRLAPENPFPTAVEDTWDAFSWTIENAPSLGIDSKNLLVGGSSSGGNLAAVIAQRARDRGIPLKGQILKVPATCHISCYPPELNIHSLEEQRDAPILSKLSMQQFWGHYSPPDPRDPEVSPLLNPNLKGLAPAYLQIAGLDPLRDEGLAYAEKLKQAGVPTRVDIYPGLPHVFVLYPELAAGPLSVQDLVSATNQLSQGELGVGEFLRGQTA